jgi:hypothetical protein
MELLEEVDPLGAKILEFGPRKKRGVNGTFGGVNGTFVK